MASYNFGPERFEPVRELIQQRLVDSVLPSLAVAVVYQGHIVWEEGFGWADREKRLPATAHTMYSLASISKPITATGLMILQERGALDLDRPINDYLGEAKVTARVGNAEEATVRRVANHTSGLPLHCHFFPDDELYVRPAMDETIRRYANLVTIPGERFQYSNLGYGLFDHVISRLTGASYADFLRQEVFLPLGMNRSSVHVGSGLEPYQAARYRSGGIRLPFYDFDHPGGSAVFASAHDLIRFALFHLKTPLADQKAILTDATLDAMHRPTAVVSETSVARVGYGVGWRIREDQTGYLKISHDGGMDGVSTSLELIPSAQVAVVALANAVSDLPRRVVEEVYKVLLPGYPDRPSSTRGATPPEETFTPPIDLLGTWQGKVHTYVADLPFTIEVRPDGNVHARLGSQPWTLLNDVRLQDGWLTGRMMGDIGTSDANRRPYLLHADLRLRGQLLNGALISKPSPEIRFANWLSHWIELRKAE